MRKACSCELQQQIQSYEHLHAGWLPFGSSPPQIPAIQSFYWAYCKGTCKTTQKKVSSWYATKKHEILSKPMLLLHASPPQTLGQSLLLFASQEMLQKRRTPLVCSKVQQTITSLPRGAPGDRRREFPRSHAFFLTQDTRSHYYICS